MPRAIFSAAAIASRLGPGSSWHSPALTGHCHAIMFNKLMPWDHLPGTLICAEAGGHVARFDGSTYRVEHLSGGLLVATDPDTWALLRREVFTV